MCTLVIYLWSCSELVSYCLFFSGTFGGGKYVPDGYLEATRGWSAWATCKSLYIWTALSTTFQQQSDGWRAIYFLCVHAFIWSLLNLEIIITAGSVEWCLVEYHTLLVKWSLLDLFLWCVQVSQSAWTVTYLERRTKKRRRKLSLASPL